MRVLFATSECVPFFKLGGLGDVSQALPAALQRQHVDVVIIMPHYDAIKKFGTIKTIGSMAVTFAGKRELVYLDQGTLPYSSVPVIFFRHRRLNKYFNHAFLFFCVCAVSFYQNAQDLLGYSFDICHCNDWHTALIPVLLGEHDKFHHDGVSTPQSRSVKSVLTIHNMLYQGCMTSGLLHDVGIPLSSLHPLAGMFGDRYINLFREGLEHADIISTVSPSYAKEILSPSFGPHVYDVMRRREDDIVGILNGIDMRSWNPHTDPHLYKNYSMQTVRKGKSDSKSYLQRSLGLPVEDVLLFGFVGRIEPRQKGIDLIMQAIRRMPVKAFQLIVLGTGDAAQVKALKALDTKMAHVVFINTFDERLARRIYAGSDVLLVPSKFEPCGLTQMIAMRYGSLPLVRKTGGLADSVVDGRTGFVFSDYTVEDLCTSMWKAVVLWEDHPAKWRLMVNRVMREDFSWKRSAKQYVRMYTSLLAKKK